MTKEQFLAIGLTEEQATKAAEESKKELETYIPKQRFDEVNTAKKKAEDDVKARDKQIEELKKVDAEGLQAKITELQEANKTAEKKYQADLKDLKLTNAIKAGLSNAQDLELVAGLIDKSKLILGDDGKVTGLEEQVKALQESKGFLFKQEEQNQAFGGFKPNQSNAKPGSTGMTREKFLAMPYKARMELYNSNPAFYDALIKQ